MMGLQSWMLWLGWFLHAFMVNVVSICVITFVMKVALWDAKYPPIEHCSASLFFIFLLLYCAAGIMFCFAISSLFNKRKYFIFYFIFEVSMDSYLKLEENFEPWL